MSHWIILIFSFAALIAMPFKAQGEASIDGAPYMTIWKYSGKKDFKTANLLGLTLNDGRFETDRLGVIKSMPARVMSCASLLTYQQSFSLSVMNDWAYLDLEQVDFQKSVEKTVIPDQITFTEVSAFAEKANFDEKGKPIPAKQRGRVLKSIRETWGENLMEKKKSAMWMVAGQTLKPDGVFGIVHHDLPWQADPELAVPAKMINNNDYFYKWEFGRAAQVDARSIDYNIRALGVLAYQEMKHLEPIAGKREGYIFVHALNASRTRLFEKIYGAKRFPEGWKNDDNCVLVMKMSEAIERIKPEKISARVAKMIELSGEVLTGPMALEILDEHLNAYRTDLDFIAGGGIAEHIVVEDMSLFGYKTAMMDILRSKGVRDENAVKIFRFLAQQIYTDKQDPDSYHDYAFVQNASRRFAAENTVQISNLNEESAKDGPEYVRSVMRAVYDLQMKKIGGSREAMPKGISVRTSSRIISNQLSDLGSRKLAIKHGEGGTIDVHFFKLDQIESFNATATLREGYWKARRLLTHPMQF